MGVDIGSDAVKLVRCRRRGPTWELQASTVIRRARPWPSLDPRRSEPTSSAGEMCAVVSANRHWRSGQVACAPPMAICEHRVVHAMAGSEAELRQQVEQEFGVHGAHVECEFWPSKIPTDDGIHLNVVWIRSDWGRQIAADHRRAGLSCSLLDDPATVIARAVDLSDQGTNGNPIAAVDWGYSGVTLCVVCQGTAEYVRRLEFAGLRELTQHIAQELGLSAKEAHEVLFSVGLPGSRTSRDTSELANVVADNLAAPLDRLADEVKKCLTFLNSHARDLAPVAIQLLGGGATLKNSDHFFAEKVGLPSSVWSLPSADHSTAARASYPAPLLASAAALSLVHC